MMGIKNIVFDFGGVVVDLCRENAVERFIQLGLTDADSRLDKYQQKGIFDELENGSLSTSQFIDKLSVLCRQTLSYDAVFHAWMGFFKLPVDSRRLEYLRSLHGKYRLFLLSNTNPFVEKWFNGPSFTSSGNNMHDYFDKEYLSFQMRCTKPSGEIFRKMLQDAQIEPEETLFVDDGESNIFTAHKLHFNTFQVTQGVDWSVSLSKKLDERLDRQ